MVYQKLNIQINIKQSEFITDRQQLLDRYMKNFFFSDIVAVIFIVPTFFNQFELPDMLQRILFLPVFVKVKNVSMMLEEQKEYIGFSDTAGYIWDLCKLILQTVITCHIVGTLYHTLAIVEKNLLDLDDNWLDTQGIYDEEWHIRYMESFYWAIATIMLIGTKGQTFLETIFCCITLLITVGMFAKILSKIQMILEEMHQKTKNYREDQKILLEFFDRCKQISTSTQGMLLNYLKYYYIGHEDKNSQENVKVVLKKFPQELQKKVNHETYREYISKFHFLNENFSKESVEKIMDIGQIFKVIK
ncbi:Cyclic nucleotide-binding protein [Pseudocohnilembus persalinus]|uniref:Cyclic nucleotide-binding protein n=1 Tax=Pseudocohnilembus persalinus TaxID=266149 RepID=A0A0V0QBH7_PSEPJ|nr:Cyclic nucleotide-binding protein [Pseudocohnilembus persalinus]|eukprot:KRW99582.1 Cyclic nucleotide-binding protein [Pseudocohnilembus persalinus]